MSEVNELDNALLAQIKAGDPDALVEFVEQKRPQLTAFIQHNLSDALRRKVEPEDILQETTLSALGSLEDVKLDQYDPFNWLCRLAERRIIDAHRRLIGAQKRSAEREVALGTPGTETRQGGLIDLLVASMTSPSQAFSRDQREFKLLAALESLPDDNRRALRLRYVEGLPTKEVARHLEKTDGAVRVLLTRSLKKLRDLLSEDSQFQPGR